MLSPKSIFNTLLLFVISLQAHTENVAQSSIGFGKIIDWQPEKTHVCETFTSDNKKLQMLFFPFDEKNNDKRPDLEGFSGIVKSQEGGKGKFIFEDNLEIKGVKVLYLVSSGKPNSATPGTENLLLRGHFCFIYKGTYAYISAEETALSQSDVPKVIDNIKNTITQNFDMMVKELETP